MSNSLRSHGLQPTGLLCPWDFPGYSTGVDCHFLLQGIFPTQGSNPGLPHCRQMLNHLSHQSKSLVYSKSALVKRNRNNGQVNRRYHYSLYCTALEYSQLLSISLFPSFIGLCYAYPLLKANFTHAWQFLPHGSKPSVMSHALGKQLREKCKKKY